MVKNLWCSQLFTTVLKERFHFSPCYSLFSCCFLNKPSLIELKDLVFFFLKYAVPDCHMTTLLSSESF